LKIVCQDFQNDAETIIFGFKVDVRLLQEMQRFVCNHMNEAYGSVK